ncbi:MAG: Crp/Fnr family transcriptional regulator [Gammaproteobacteria bacterium]|nr:Crp/Fnr family transcriptional regulator [Gammaproteobacteria bacterium]
MFKDIALFTDLPESDLSALTGHATTRRYKKNTIVVTKGDDSDSLYVILSGRMRVYLDDEQGNEITIRNLEPGEAFGELALLSGEPRAANVVTLEDCELSVVSKQDFMSCLTNNPSISFRIIKSLVERIQAMTEDISSLALLDVYGRVAKVLTKNAREQDGKLVTSRVTHQEIANLVGASREMVSRILKDLRAGGYISVEDKRITLERNLPPGW